MKNKNLFNRRLVFKERASETMVSKNVPSKKLKSEVEQILNLDTENKYKLSKRLKKRNNTTFNKELDFVFAELKKVKTKFDANDLLNALEEHINESKKSLNLLNNTKATIGKNYEKIIGNIPKIKFTTNEEQVAARKAKEQAETLESLEDKNLGGLPENAAKARKEMNDALRGKLDNPILRKRIGMMILAKKHLSSSNYEALASKIDSTNDPAKKDEFKEQALYARYHFKYLENEKTEKQTLPKNKWTKFDNLRTKADDKFLYSSLSDPKYKNLNEEQIATEIIKKDVMPITGSQKEAFKLELYTDAIRATQSKLDSSLIYGKKHNTQEVLAWENSSDEEKAKITDENYKKLILEIGSEFFA